MAITPQNEPISALLSAITPQSTCCPMTALAGHHSVSSPRLGRNQALRTVSSAKPNKLPSSRTRKTKNATGNAR